MPTGPKIRLAVDLHRIDKYFPLNYDLEGGFDFDMVIDRQKYNDMAVLLKKFDIDEDRIVREFCFILLWIEKEIGPGNGRDDYSGKYYQMWTEIDDLKNYLVNNRIVSISFQGETGRNKPNTDLTMKEDINIDRICDGIRSVFRDEFNHGKQKRRTKGLTAWQRRKMTRIRNNFLNYFSSIPGLDEHSLEDQNQLIGMISALVIMPGQS